MNSTLDQMSWLKPYWSPLVDDRVLWRDPRSAFESLPEAYATATLKDDHPSAAATDCRSLYDPHLRAVSLGCTFARAIKELPPRGSTD